MNRSIPFYRGIQKKLDRISLISRENLSGARVIRAFSKQESEKERFQQASDDLSKTAIRVGKISALLNPATTVILNIAIIGIVWYGGCGYRSAIFPRARSSPLSTILIRFCWL